MRDEIRIGRAVCIGLGLGALAIAVVALALPPGSTPRELELGEEAAHDIAKSMALVDDEDTLAKVQKMLDTIAAATPRPEIEYRAHIVASPLINAFVIPGGWVYVTVGLLEAVESDDELAGVMAHEIAHNVNQHAIQRMRSIPKGLGLLQLASIAALIVTGSPEAAVLANVAASTITAAVLNGGSVEAEVEADADGLYYMTLTEYDPVGFLTFMERLASSSSKFIEEQLGIYQTHPLTRDRVRAARDRLEELGIPILRRLVTHAPQPEARMLVREGLEITEIVYQGKPLLVLRGQDPDRADAAIATIAWALDYELDATRLKILPAEGGLVFRPEGGPSLFLRHDDAVGEGTTEAVVALRLRNELAALVASEKARVLANYQLY